MQRIGVRELRQHASRYLARVAQGEQIEVTDRGRPVAMLVPVRGSDWHDLLARQRIAVPTEDVDVVGEEPGEYEVDASRVLEAMRESER
jgi:prevent-host-death family protein